MEPNSTNNLFWLTVYKDLLLVLAGGFCAAFGGFASTWYLARKARRIKMEETIGQQKVEIYKKALRLVDQLDSVLKQGAYQDVLDFIKKENTWVLDNEILLPQIFAKCWHSVRLNVFSGKKKSEHIDKSIDGKERDKQIDEVLELDEFVLTLVHNAEEEIRKELRLKPFRIYRPQK